VKGWAGLARRRRVAALATVLSIATMATAATAGSRFGTAATSRDIASTESVQVPILMYHYVRINPLAADELGSRLSVQPAMFALQMALLHDNGFHPLSMERLMDAIDAGTPLPSNPVVLTFDDGYSDFATVAAPVMRAFRMTGTTYVVPGFVGLPNYMTREQLHEVASAGMEIAAHTMHHPDLAHMGAAQAQGEITASRQVLQQWTGQHVDAFAYPYGAFNSQTPGLVSAAGFRSAVTTQDGRTETASGRYLLPRVRISGGDSLASFAAKLRVGLPPSPSTQAVRLDGEAGAALRGPTVGMLTTPSGHGYGLFDFDGLLHSYGDFVDHGGTATTPLNRPIVTGASTPSGAGYWLVGADGGVFTFGDAVGYGSIGGRVLNRPIVSMAATPDGAGYWLASSDGGVFPFGDAVGLGSMGGRVLNRPIVSLVATHTGKGYWLIASDGGVFPFGDAVGLGSTGGVVLNKAIVGAVSTADDAGYWLVAADGGIFTFGDAVGHGSTGGMVLNRPIVGMTATSAGDGYWLVASDGGVFPFGAAQGYGSAAA
jgi:peptidoglycan/xylan/chitin deacetylase (PgdA/CDA1 family)